MNSDTHSPRTLIVGDIHGCDRALEALLELAEWRSDGPLICVGDLIDRGPNTRGVLDRLLDLGRHGPVTIVRGNHEEMFLDALAGGPWTDAWRRHGGLEMLGSYGAARPEEIPENHVALLQTSVDFVELPGAVIVHAAVDPTRPLAEQTAHTLRWQRLDKHAPPHPSGRTVICGHSPQERRRVHSHRGWIGLDTWVYDRSGCLTALELETGTLYQASEWDSWLNIARLDSAPSQ